MIEEIIKLSHKVKILDKSEREGPKRLLQRTKTYITHLKLHFCNEISRGGSEKKNPKLKFEYFYD